MAIIFAIMFAYDVCMGFGVGIAPIHTRTSKSDVPFGRSFTCNLPLALYKDYTEKSSVLEFSSPLVSATDATTIRDPRDPNVDSLNGLTLIPLNYETDIEPFIDTTRPYYALNNEHSIVDSQTGKSVGFVCTVKREMPIAREKGGVSSGEAGECVSVTS